MKRFLKSFYAHLVDFAYPQICVACEKHTTETESAICFECLWELPRTNIHLSEENALERKFWGKVKIDNVYSFLHFSKKGKVQNILHALKYRNSPELGKFLGKVYANDLQNLLSSENVDMLIPVPLHKKRFKVRGYNQAASFAEGLSESLAIPVHNDILSRNRYTDSQTKTAGRFERFRNIEDVFDLITDPTGLNKKNVALVDDVLTSGATLEVAAKKLREAGVNKLYVITIAAA